MLADNTPKLGRRPDVGLNTNDRETVKEMQNLGRRLANRRPGQFAPRGRSREY
jgi:hypothetical protein